MATMHGKGKGKSGSKKPVDKTKPIWVKYSKEEVETIIIKLAKQELTSAKIGLVLRDVYGIPLVKPITNQKISQILKKHDLQPKEPYDLTDLIKRATQLKKHVEKNNHDQVSKRGLHLTEAKIRRAAKYYKKKGVLDKKWKY